MVPKALRESLGLVAGADVELAERGGELVLRLVGPRIVLEERDGRKVFVTEGEQADVLTDDEVRRLVEESRQWPHG